MIRIIATRGASQVNHKLIAQLLRQLANAIEADAPVEPPAQACEPAALAPEPPAATPAPALWPAPEAADLIRVMTELAKKHGRQAISALTEGKRVSEMTDGERLALSYKLEDFQ
jgi:hypothetical protein